MYTEIVKFQMDLFTKSEIFNLKNHALYYFLISHILVSEAELYYEVYKITSNHSFSSQT